MKSGKIRKGKVWQTSKPVTGAVPVKGHAVLGKYLSFLIYFLVSVMSSPEPYPT